MLDQAAAWLGYELHAEHPGGDHAILVGAVVDAGAGAGHPLVRFDGAFA